MTRSGSGSHHVIRLILVFRRRHLGGNKTFLGGYSCVSSQNYLPHCKVKSTDEAGQVDGNEPMSPGSRNTALRSRSMGVFVCNQLRLLIDRKKHWAET